jgi:hypothetical protein
MVRWAVIGIGVPLAAAFVRRLGRGRLARRSADLAQRLTGHPVRRPAHSWW